MEEWEQLKGQLQPSRSGRLAQRAVPVPVLGRLARRVLFQRMLLGYDVAPSFIR